MQYTLTRSHVHKLATDLLVEHLKLTDYKRKCPARTLVSILFAACARLVSISAAAADFLWAPSPETVRKALCANTPKNRDPRTAPQPHLAGLRAQERGFE